jgi:hypothetical protein
MTSMFWTEARRFGVGACVVLGLVAAGAWRWRHHPRAAAAVAGTGVLLAVGAFAAPSLVLALRRVWMAFARLLGRVNGTILLIVIFYFLLTPFALVRRLARRRGAGGWRPCEPSPRDHFENPY